MTLHVVDLENSKPIEKKTRKPKPQTVVPVAEPESEEETVPVPEPVVAVVAPVVDERKELAKQKRLAAAAARAERKQQQAVEEAAALVQEARVLQAKKDARAAKRKQKLEESASVPQQKKKKLPSNVKDHEPIKIGVKHDDDAPPSWFKNYVKQEYKSDSAPKALRKEADDITTTQWADPQIRQTVMSTTDKYNNSLYKQIFGKRKR
jgi:hypothetical protein